MKKINRLTVLLLLCLLTAGANAQEIKSWKLPDLKAAIENAKVPTIFNFWATFCKPCIAEIPYFEKLVKKYDSAGVKLILVSLDAKELYPQKLKNFVSKRKFRSPVVFLDETNADLFCPAVDPKWSGAIPASLFINNKTGYRAFFEDQLKEGELEGEIRKMIR